MEGSSRELISTRSPVEPKFIYDQLLIRQTPFYHHIKLFTAVGVSFLEDSYSSLEELICTMKERDAARKVAQIDTMSECAVSSQPPMHAAKRSRSASEAHLGKSSSTAGDMKLKSWTGLIY
jgi:hypothetical protein